MRIVILGGGLVGAPMAFDLSEDKDFEITVVDKEKTVEEKFRHKKNIKFMKADLSVEENICAIVSNYDIVLSAVPGYLGFKMLKAVIQCGKNVVDIAFFPEDLFELDHLCKKHNVIAISDMGVAPGMSNMLLAYAADRMDEVLNAKIYVGGLPKTRTLPWEYKAVFSPIDVIEEYTRTARYICNNELVEKAPLTEAELIEFDGVGTLEAFNSDGLRSLLKTIKAQNLIEKTLRYPGHIDKIKMLKESGFFSEEEILVHGKLMRPIDFTTSVLFPKWKLNDGEEDITVMRIIVEGIKEGQHLKHIYDLHDEYHHDTGIHSMARTTGYAATMAVRMLAKGLYNHIGISPPEYIGSKKSCVSFMLEGLRKRGVEYNEKILAL